jgi:hypothetical protein
MKKTTRTKDFKFFKESLREGLKYAQGKPAKVKVETLYIKTATANSKSGNKAFIKAMVEGLKDVEKGKTLSVAEAKMKFGLK